jgi:copper chaperone
MRTVTLRIQGMSCAHCQQAVRQALTAVAGVERAEVSLAEGRAEVAYDPERATLEALLAAVRQEGYEATLAE